MKIFLLLQLTLCLVWTQSLGAKLKAIDDVEKTLDVEIITDTTFHGTWSSVSYNEVQDTTQLINYLKLLLIEYKKYPAEYLHNVNIKKIILCKNLYFEDQNRAAIPDPYKQALYLAIDTSYSENYLIHVMHHELHHCTEYTLYGDMFYKWRKWNKINTWNFAYGNGGKTAYEECNKGINWYDMCHPKKGFVNLYSTTGQEEDRSEIVALIMNDNERELLIEYCRKDKRLKRKVKLILKELDKIVGSPSEYWDVKMKRNI